MMAGGFAGVYQGRSVLVTGHTGFKGSWLSIWLNELGADVVGYALNPGTERDNFAVTGLSKRITDIRGDVRDGGKLLSVLGEYRPEFVFHLAAQPLVGLSYRQPGETYEINIMGTVNLLEAVRLVDSVKVVILITSDKCYENREMIWGYRENDPVGGVDPYSSSKACAEIIASAYRESFFNQGDNSPALATVRAGNVIGGGDWAQGRIIPDCIKSLEGGREIEVRSPGAVRPWQHVLEPLNGYLLLGAKLFSEPDRYQGAWNFGPAEGMMVTVEELVEKLISCWGSGSWRKASGESFRETGLLKLDISKSRHYLGWKPRLSIDKMLEMTVDWYRNAQPSYEYDVRQIEDFQSDFSPA